MDVQLGRLIPKRCDIDLRGGKLTPEHFLRKIKLFHELPLIFLAKVHDLGYFWTARDQHQPRIVALVFKQNTAKRQV